LCYEAQLEAKYEDFKRRYEYNARLDTLSMEVIVKQVKCTYDSGVKGEKDEFDRWYDVWLGGMRFGDMLRESYTWRCRRRG